MTTSRGIAFISIIAAVVFLVAVVSFTGFAKDKITHVIDYKVKPKLFGIKKVQIETPEQFHATVDCLIALQQDKKALVEELSYTELEGTGWGGCTVAGSVPKLVRVNFTESFSLGEGDGIITSTKYNRGGPGKPLSLSPGEPIHYALLNISTETRARELAIVVEGGNVSTISPSSCYRQVPGCVSLHVQKGDIALLTYRDGSGDPGITWRASASLDFTAD